MRTTGSVGTRPQPESSDGSPLGWSLRHMASVSHTGPAPGSPSPTQVLALRTASVQWSGGVPTVSPRCASRRSRRSSFGSVVPSDGIRLSSSMGHLLPSIPLSTHGPSQSLSRGHSVPASSSCPSRSSSSTSRFAGVCGDESVCSNHTRSLGSSGMPTAGAGAHAPSPIATGRCPPKRVFPIGAGTSLLFAAAAYFPPLSVSSCPASSRGNAALTALRSRISATCSSCSSCARMSPPRRSDHPCTPKWALSSASAPWGMTLGCPSSLFLARACARPSRRCAASPGESPSASLRSGSHLSVSPSRGKPFHCTRYSSSFGAPDSRTSTMRSISYPCRYLSISSWSGATCRGGSSPCHLSEKAQSQRPATASRNVTSTRFLYSSLILFSQLDDRPWVCTSRRSLMTSHEAHPLEWYMSTHLTRPSPTSPLEKTTPGRSHTTHPPPSSGAFHSRRSSGQPSSLCGQLLDRMPALSLCCSQASM